MTTFDISPMDSNNQALLENVHPEKWTSPRPEGRYHIVVIGAGTAGLVTAAGAAGLGARVALIERHLMGGDCLNVGCVPSKALIRAARAIADVRRADSYGIRVGEVAADFPSIMRRLRRLRAQISEHDSARRFRDLGIDVFFGSARFLDSESVEVGGTRLRFKKAVIATGARASRPAISGLAEAGYLTNETVFNLTELPRRLAVIGGGPIGCEMAQAFCRLGSQVILIHNKKHLLDKEDADAAAVVQQTFVREGITVALDSSIDRIDCGSNQRTIHLRRGSEAHAVEVDAILVAAGRTPNVEGMQLETVGVACDGRNGVEIDEFFRTTNPRIYAAGDVCMRWKFTHAADAAARIVIQNALFLGRRKASSLVMPWCTYTDPEIAHVGLAEHEAHSRGIEIDIFTRPFEKVDRAIVDGETEGFVKVLVARGSSRIVGATIVARHAGEMINEVTLAMARGIGLGALSGVIHPYPTQAEAIRQTADAYNKTRLTPFVKSLLGTWLRWTR